MVFIKYILIFFIFIISTKIGNIYSKKYVKRVEELEQIDNLLNIFKSKIKFTCQTIKEIFEQISKDNENVIGQIFSKTNEYMEKDTAKNAWEKALDEQIVKTSLKKQDIDTIKTLGKMLGNTDVEGQISQIELTQNLLKEKIEEAQKEKIKNAKLYNNLGVGVGLAIVIILI